MSTVMCHGLQTCLDPQVKQTDTLLLFLENNTTSHMIPNLDLSSWSFLQSPSNSSQPKVSNSFSSPRLNERSLELCTENLGNETGSDTSDNSILESRNEKPSKESHLQNIKQISSVKKANLRSFPPPLTTIRRANSYQVRPHREGGRLIIKVVEAPSIDTCFEVHRAHGRLQLRFSENCMQKVISLGNQEDVGENFEDEESVENLMNKDMDGNESDVEVKLGMEKNERPNRRCKESESGTS